MTTTAAPSCSPASHLHRLTVYLQYSFRTSTCSARPFCPTMKWLACRQFPSSRQHAFCVGLVSQPGRGQATSPAMFLMDSPSVRSSIMDVITFFELPHHAGRDPYGEPVVLSWQHSWFEDLWLVARIHLVLDFWSPRSPRASLLAVADPESHVLFHPRHWLALRYPSLFPPR